MPPALEHGLIASAPARAGALSLLMCSVPFLFPFSPGARLDMHPFPPSRPYLGSFPPPIVVSQSTSEPTSWPSSPSTPQGIRPARVRRKTWWVYSSDRGVVSDALQRKTSSRVGNFGLVPRLLASSRSRDSNRGPPVLHPRTLLHTDAHAHTRSASSPISRLSRSASSKRLWTGTSCWAPSLSLASGSMRCTLP